MRCSRDIKLESSGAVYYFRFLPWDTKFFGRNSYALDDGRSVLKPRAEIPEMLERRMGNTFISAKIDSREDKGVIDLLQRAGFRYIDTEVVLKYRGPGRTAGSPVSVCVQEVRRNGGLPYAELGTSFTCTRFHSDKNIAREKADLLWVHFIKNYRPSAVNRIFTAKLNNRVVGAILAHKEKAERRVRLSFVAVLEEFRNKNVGTSLIQYAVNCFKGFEITTGTQAKNVGALNFYVRNGFSRIKNSKAIMHRWQS